MHIYKPGSQFLLHGRRETVDYVMVKRNGLLVYLRGQVVPCQPEELVPLPGGLPQPGTDRALAEGVARV